jgi:hypothetical protein
MQITDCDRILEDSPTIQKIYTGGMPSLRLGYGIPNTR